MKRQPPKLLSDQTKTLAADNARVDALVESLGAPVVPPPNGAQAVRRSAKKRSCGLPEPPPPAGGPQQARRRERKSH